jgi:hypothetical protein
MKRWLVTLGGGALALTIIFNGIGSPVFAQDDTATPEDATETIDPQQAYLEALAEELGIPVEDLEAAVTNARLDKVDLWAEQARVHISEGEGLFPAFPGMGGMVEPAMGGTMKPRFEHRIDARGHGAFLESMDDFAAFLGITEDEIISSLQDGMTILEIAEANGKTYDDVRAFLIEQATSRIDERLQEMVSDGAGAAEETSDTTEALDPAVDVATA